MTERRTELSGTGNGDDLDQGEVLRQLAEDKIVASSGRSLRAEGFTAARLLADIYAVGLTHGITPQEWAWVTDLPDACWHASRDAACRQQRARLSAKPDREPDGRTASGAGDAAGPALPGARPLPRFPAAVPKSSGTQPMTVQAGPDGVLHEPEFT